MNQISTFEFFYPYIEMIFIWTLAKFSRINFELISHAYSVMISKHFCLTKKHVYANNFQETFSRKTALGLIIPLTKEFEAAGK